MRAKSGEAEWKATHYLRQPPCKQPLPLPLGGEAPASLRVDTTANVGTDVGQGTSGEASRERPPPSLLRGQSGGPAGGRCGGRRAAPGLPCTLAGGVGGAVTTTAPYVPAAGGCVRHDSYYFCIKNHLKGRRSQQKLPELLTQSALKKTTQPSLLKECSIKTKRPVFS